MKATEDLQKVQEVLLVKRPSVEKLKEAGEDVWG